MSERTKIAILGSTGSVGVQALDLIAQFPERFEVVALAAGSRLDLLGVQVRRFRPRLAGLARGKKLSALQAICGPLGIAAAVREEGLVQAATHSEADRILSAIVG